MGVDLYRLGIGVVLLALLFPLVDIVERLGSSETAGVMSLFWLVGVALVIASSLTGREECRGRA